MRIPQIAAQDGILSGCADHIRVLTFCSALKRPMAIARKNDHVWLPRNPHGSLHGAQSGGTCNTLQGVYIRKTPAFPDAVTACFQFGNDQFLRQKPGAREQAAIAVKTDLPVLLGCAYLHAGRRGQKEQGGFRMKTKAQKSFLETHGAPSGKTSA